MARIRTIKPEFWTSYVIGQLKPEARLLFLCLLNHVDDEGRMKDPFPERLKLLALPYDRHVGEKHIAGYLEAMIRLGLVRIYVVDGRVYLWVAGFREHQRINRPTASVLPAFTVTSESSVSAIGSIIGERKGRKGKEGRERKELDVELVARPDNSTPDIDQVVNHYRTYHPQSNPNRDLIAKSLKIRTAPELCTAIDGNHMSSFHCGENERGTRYHGLGLILRSDDHITKFIEIADEGPEQVKSEKTRRRQRALQTWLEGEGTPDDA